MFLFKNKKLMQRVYISMCRQALLISRVLSSVSCENLQLPILN